MTAVFLLLGLFWRAPLAPLNRLWFRFGMILHAIVSPLVLGLIFYLVVTPTALLLRAIGKDPLRLRPDRAAASYWIAKAPPGPPPDTMKQQF
jgi:hypothetical protein